MIGCVHAIHELTAGSSPESHLVGVYLRDSLTLFSPIITATDSKVATLITGEAVVAEKTSAEPAELDPVTLTVRYFPAKESSGTTVSNVAPEIGVHPSGAVEPCVGDAILSAQLNH